MIVDEEVFLDAEVLVVDVVVVVVVIVLVVVVLVVVVVVVVIVVVEDVVVGAAYCSRKKFWTLKLVAEAWNVSDK